MSHHEVDRSGEERLTDKRLKTKPQSRAEERPLGFVRFLIIAYHHELSRERTKRTLIDAHWH